MLNFTLQSTGRIPSMDGSICFSLSDGSIHVVCGWTSPATTYKTHFKSMDGGVTFTALSDFPFVSHTLAYTQVGDVVYVVGGDIYNVQNDGTHKKTSYKFENGTWTLIASDCGIGNRILSDLVYHNNAFYLIGGQSDLTVGSAFNTIMKSTDNCNSFQVINSQTTPLFYGGLSQGSFISKWGFIWKFGGGVYSNQLNDRTYDTAIYRSADGITWEYFGEMPCVGRHYHRVLSVGNKGYILTGVNGAYGLNLNDSWSFDYSNNKLYWNFEGVGQFTPRHAAGICKYLINQIVVIGGSQNNNTANSQVWLSNNII